MSNSIVICTSSASFTVTVKQKDYLVLATQEQWLTAQIARHIRERLSAFVRYRAHAFGAKHTNPDAFIRINNIGYLASCLNGKPLHEVCRLLQKRASDIEACLPAQSSKHAFWRTEILTLIDYAIEFNTRHAVCGREGAAQVAPHSTTVQPTGNS